LPRVCHDARFAGELYRVLILGHFALILLIERRLSSALLRSQLYANFAIVIVAEGNPGVFESFLYFENCGEVSLHDAFALFDPL
jgi:hypothetical protein